MRKKYVSALALLFAVTLCTNAQNYGDYPIQGVPFSDVTLTDNFWLPRLEQNQKTTIPIALDQCWNTGRVDNFLKAAAIMKGDYSLGWFATDYTFDDTDIYKILEGMSYSYKMMPSENIKEKMDQLVKIVADAQEPDGYLTTARTAGKPGSLHSWLGTERWEKDPDLSHELYNSGHLFEAAAAHYQATGERGLLDVACKNADLLVQRFLKDGLAYEPGHQIVEMGLVKMYRITGKEDYLKLAKYFLDIRGVNGPNSKHYEYDQSHMPPADQREAVGHAVRATYMYSGMADVAAIMHAKEYQTAIDEIWNNVVEKKYYITGGIGAIHDGEKFGANYDLPNLTAYNETCAAIANVYWNWRMFLTYGDSKYYDVIERTLYNGVLSGISLSGDHFFYPNPLESTGGYSRSAWFGCACCPSNLCRFIPSVPGYIYAHNGDTVYVNLYVQGSTTVDLGEGNKITLTQKTDYPWDGAVRLSVDNAPQSEATLKVRIPAWAKGKPCPGELYSYINDDSTPIELLLNGKKVEYKEEKGYMTVSRVWRKGDELSFNFPMNVRRVVADDKVVADRGKVSLERGPIVYCLEWKDNDGEVLTSVVPDDATITVRDDNTLLGELPNNNVKVLEINGAESEYDDKGDISATSKKLTAIPYYAWANRGAGQMEVWMARTPAKAEVSTKNVSFTDTLKINVGETPSATFGSTGYPSVPVKVDIAAVAKAFGISVSEVKSLFGTQITYAAIEPDGTVNTTSTAGAPGHWFTEEGKVTNWESTGKVSVIFSEFDKNNFVFNIGQYPASWKHGDVYTIRQALTYLPTGAAPRRVVFEFKVEATNAQGVYENELRTAKKLLESDSYENVNGTVRTDLQSAVDNPVTTDYARATQQLYRKVASFVDAKVSFDEYSAAVSAAMTACQDYPYAAKSKQSALLAVCKNEPSSAIQAEQYAEEVNKALRAVILSNADAEAIGTEENLIANPEFAYNNGSTADGWEITTFIAGFKNIVNEASYDTSANPYFVNYGSWGQGNSSFDFKMEQTVSGVGEGTYLISLMSRGKDLDVSTLTVTTSDGETVEPLTVKGNSGQMFGYGWDNTWFLLPVKTVGNVTLTINASAGKDQTFISLGRFRMIRISDETAINGVANGNKEATNEAIYNVAGQSVDSREKGILIKKGKKFFIR